MKFKILSISLFGIVLLSFSMSFAQDSNQLSAKDSLLYKVIKKLDVEKLLRVQLTDKVRITGIYSEFIGDTLFLIDSLGKRAVPVGSIDIMWKRGRATKTGLLIGSIVGTQVGLIGGYCAAGLMPGDAAVNFLVGTLTGILTGGLIGSAIGAVIKKWHRCFSPPDPEEILPPDYDGRYD
ncbi:MAG: hypothetical protein V3V99_07720 [candidate division Zixibacteria bacterium]